MSASLRYIARIALAFGLVGAGAADLIAQAASAPSQAAGEPFQMTASEGKRRFETTGRGAITFTADLSDVETLSDGGYVTIRDTDPVSHVIEIRSQSGTISRTYRVDGIERPWDAEARRMLASNIAWLVRRSGLGAQERTRDLLQRRGVEGVLEEVARLESDFVRRLYLVELMRAARIDGSAMARVLATAAASMRSSFDLSEVMVAAAQTAARDEAAAQAYVNAAAKLSSDHERRRVLTALLAATGSSAGVSRLVLQSATSLSSDYDRGELLAELIRRNSSGAAGMPALLAQVGTIRSDYERRRLLTQLIERGGVSQQTIADLIGAAVGMRSDHDRAELLLALAANGLVDSASRSAFVSAAEAIRSPYDRNRVLAAEARSHR